MEDTLDQLAEAMVTFQDRIWEVVKYVPDAALGSRTLIRLASITRGFWLP